MGWIGVVSMVPSQLLVTFDLCLQTTTAHMSNGGKEEGPGKREHDDTARPRDNPWGNNKP
ncbi:hypothetical protein CHS0354_007254, partial [Potamilus streckersoni]